MLKSIFAGEIDADKLDYLIGIASLRAFIMADSTISDSCKAYASSKTLRVPVIS